MLLKFENWMRHLICWIHDDEFSHTVNGSEREWWVCLQQYQLILDWKSNDISIIPIIVKWCWIYYVIYSRSKNIFEQEWQKILWYVIGNLICDIQFKLNWFYVSHNMNFISQCDFRTFFSDVMNSTSVKR